MENATSSVEAVPMRQVESEMEYLRSVLEILERQTNELISRLSGVLRQNTEREAPNRPPLDDIVPLACDIRSARIKVEDVNDSFTKVIEDIQL